MNTLKLQYIGPMIKDLPAKVTLPNGKVIDNRSWNVISPQLPGYTYKAMHYPTLGLESLKQYGLLK